MIEGNNPEINVDELMQKIKEEVSKRQDFNAVNTNLNSGNMTEAVALNHLAAILDDAILYSEVPTEFPKKINRFPFNNKRLQGFLLKLYEFIFRKQRVVNFSLIQALRESLTLNQQLMNQVNVLQEQLVGIEKRLMATEEQVRGKDERLSNALTATDERLTATDKRLSNALTATDERLTAIDERLSNALTATDERLTATDERYIKNDSYLKSDLNQQKRLITLFLEQARQRLPEPFSPEQLQTFVQEENHLLDAFYMAFEEHFRGSREDILTRLRVYLPLIEAARIGTPEFPILDVGCGRGEWLELLRKSGYATKGIDANRVMVEYCQAKGLEVSEFDVIDYLKSLPDASLGAVTGFHIIEHLPFPKSIELLNEVYRVLKSGGMALFETPNPQNILVGSHNFYIDPSHGNPLPSPLAQFIYEQSGFAPVKIMYLNPYNDSMKVRGSEEIVQRFNDYFYGSQDYGVVGYKP